LSNGDKIIICDCDRNNQTLTAFFGDVVERPDQPDDDSTVTFLSAGVDTAISSKISTVIDMGGGDLVFPRYASSMQLVSLLEDHGVRPVALHFLGPSIDDLSALRDIERSGAFCPPATVIVLNAGLIRDTRAPDVAFKAVREHAVVRAAVARGAVVVVMPKLVCMHEIDQRRLTFSDAQEGKVKAGQSPLGPTMRQMVAIWRRAMEVAFAPVAEWLP
jgi:DNA-binding transcriptional LysR family regulator